jgi:hypothetical protein
MDLDEAAFPMIEDVLLGHDDMSLAELSEHVIDAVARHIEDHWVPTLPLTDRNRAAVATVVAGFLLEQARWFVMNAKLQAEYDPTMLRLFDLVPVGADDSELSCGVTVGEIRTWSAQIERLLRPAALTAPAFPRRSSGHGGILVGVATRAPGATGGRQAVRRNPHMARGPSIRPGP